MSTAPKGPTPGYLVWRLSTKWRVAVDRALAPLGLTHAQYTLIASLHGVWRSGYHPSQRQLADHTGLEPLYVSKLARALESSGLVRRTPDPADTRAVQLSLTPEGRRRPAAPSRRSARCSTGCWPRSAGSTHPAPRS